MNQQKRTSPAPAIGVIAVAALPPLVSLAALIGYAPEPLQLPATEGDFDVAVAQELARMHVEQRVTDMIVLLVGVYAALAAAAALVGHLHPQARLWNLYAAVGGAMTAVMLVGVAIGLL